MDISVNDIKDLDFIINTLLEKITNDSDVVWSDYNSPEDFRADLNICFDMIKLNDIHGLEKLSYLFGPTSSIQEHSIFNGWSKEYIKLSSEFDDIYGRIVLKQKANTIFKRMRKHLNSRVQK